MNTATRDQKVTVRFTRDEKKGLEIEANEVGLTLAELIAKRGLNKNPDIEELRSQMYEMKESIKIENEQLLNAFFKKIDLSNKDLASTIAEILVEHLSSVKKKELKPISLTPEQAISTIYYREGDVIVLNTDQFRIKKIMDGSRVTLLDRKTNEERTFNFAGLSETALMNIKVFREM